MIRYLAVDEIISINRLLIKDFGGSEGIRNFHALESACTRPQSGYYSDAIEEAAALFSKAYLRTTPL